MKWGLTKRKNFSDGSIDSFRKDFDKFFDEFFSLKPSSMIESSWLPKIDVEENDRSIFIKAELPGINEKDINVTLDSDVLTIEGEKKFEQTDTSKDYCCIISERSYGSFSRTIRLPAYIKPDKISAVYKNGVLNIELPKDEKKDLKKINIEVK